MRHKPLNSYSGLTIVLNKASRFDNSQLISGHAGQIFDGFLHPLSRYECDVRTADCLEPLMEGTRVILALGEESLRLFNSTNSLHELRGNPFNFNDKTVIASYAPQDSIDRKNYEDPEEDESEAEEATGAEKGKQKTKRRNWKFWLYNDVRKATRILRDGLRGESSFNYKYYPPAQEVISILSGRKSSTLFIDIETDRSQNITCFGFSFIGCPDVYVVPIKRYTKSLAYEESSVHKILVALAVAFRDNRVVSHNGVFDWFVLAYRYKIPFPRNPFCTMVAWSRCWAEVEKSLGHLITYFTDCSYHKSDGVFDPQNHNQEQDLWKYNGKDVSRMMMVYDGMVEEIKRLGCEDSVAQANSSIRPYLTMMFKGMKIDVPRYIKRFEDQERRGEQLERCLKFITGQPGLNPRSSQKVSKYLYDDLQLPRPEEEPTNEKNLLKLLVKHNVPSIKLMLAIRGEKKLASSLKFRLWNNRFDSDEYERLTCAYNIAGTEIMRLGSRALLRFSPDKGFGTNTQNFDRDSSRLRKRDLIVADEGKILGQTDQAGADAVIMAYGCCRAGKYRQLFDNGIKPHVFVAMQIFAEHWAKLLDVNQEEFIHTSIPQLPFYKYWKDLVTLIKSDETRYYLGKKTGHSFNYEMGINTYQMSVLLETEGRIALPIADCRLFRGMYFGLFPEIAEYHENTRETIKDKRVLYNLFGYPRRFTGHFGDDLYRKGYAFTPASTVAVITHLAITRLQGLIEFGDKVLNEGEFDLLQQGHDSILWQAKEEHVMDCAKIVKDCLEIKFEHKGIKFGMGSEVGIGNRWAKYNEKICPDGLKDVKI
jgi:DNA polymerase I-like protein with 3'-5' exonuclease and polymerase domains